MEHHVQAKHLFPIQKIPKTERFFFFFFARKKILFLSCGILLLFAMTQFLCNLPDIYKLSTIIKVILNFGLSTRKHYIIH